MNKPNCEMPDAEVIAIYYMTDSEMSKPITNIKDRLTKLKLALFIEEVFTKSAVAYSADRIRRGKV